MAWPGKQGQDGKMTVLDSIESRYIKDRAIGVGAFGKAWLARSKATGTSYCVKEVNIYDKQVLSDVRKEVSVHSKLIHEFVIRFEEAIQTSKTVYIVMEYADQGDLATLLNERSGKKKHLPEDQLLVWMAQITQALAFIHRRGYIHRDVKSANIFLMRHGAVKLGDMGCTRMLEANATRMEQRTCRSPCGTPMYQAPEQTQGKEYTQKVDVWALGCVLYECCTLKPTFDARNIQELAHKIRNGLFVKRLPSCYSPELRTAMLEMLTIDDYRRPSSADVLKSTLMQKYCKLQMTPDGDIVPVDSAMSLSPLTSHVPSRASSAHIAHVAHVAHDARGVLHPLSGSGSSSRAASGHRSRTSASGSASSSARARGRVLPLDNHDDDETEAAHHNDDDEFDVPILGVSHASHGLAGSQRGSIAHARGAVPSGNLDSCNAQHVRMRLRARSSSRSSRSSNHSDPGKTTLSMSSSIAQVSASTHVRPVSRFGAAGKPTAVDAAKLPAINARPGVVSAPVAHDTSTDHEAQQPILDRFGRVIARDQHDRGRPLHPLVAPRGVHAAKPAAAGWNVPTGISLRPGNMRKHQQRSLFAAQPQSLHSLQE